MVNLGKVQSITTSWQLFPQNLFFRQEHMYYSLIKLPSLGSHLFSTLQDNPMKLNIQIGKTPHLIDVETEVALRLIPRTVKVTGEKNEKGAFHFFRVAYPVIRPCKQHLPIFT